MEELNKDSITKNENDDILSWIKYLETIRGYGEHTLDAYKRDVLEFSNFCTDKNYEFLSPDKYIFREFLSVLSERQLSRSTVARKVSSLKNFYKFLIRDKIISSLDMSIFKSPKLKRSFPKSIESNLVAQALESIMNNESDHWINLRDLSLIHI